MNRELFMVLIPGVSWTLFSLGGTQISDKVPGWKGWRRFILPAFYATAISLACPWWKAAIIAAAAASVYSLPYGDRITQKQRAMVAIAYGMLSFPIGFSAWNIITASGFMAMFELSNTKATEKIFTWKICEGLFGLLVGIEIAYKIMVP